MIYVHAYLKPMICEQKSAHYVQTFFKLTIYKNYFFQVDAESLAVMDEDRGHPRGDVCRMLQSVILQICKEHYQACGDVEVDAIICLSTLNSESQDVVKIHKILPSSNFKNRRKRLANPPLEQFHREQDSIPIYISKESDSNPSTNFQIKEEVDIEFIAQQNNAHLDEGELKSEEDPDSHNSSLDHTYNENLSTIEMDQNLFILNQDEETESTVSQHIAIKEEHQEAQETRPPNYSSRPKRKQNPKRIVRVQYFQNSFEKDHCTHDNETENSFPDETVNESEFMSQKCVIDGSEDGVECETAYSVDDKPVCNYADSEIDLDLTTETEPSLPEVEVLDLLPELPENTRGEKASRHRNKKISLNVIHNKSKVFKCSKCGSGFSSKKSQMRHERYNCGDIPHFECNVCGKFYSRADSKTRHLWKIHGIKISTPDKNNPMDFP